MNALYQLKKTENAAKWIWSALLVLVAVTCGGQTPNDEVVRSPESLAKSAILKDQQVGDPSASAKKSLDFTVNRPKRTVDFLMLNEPNAVFSTPPLSERMTMIADAFAGRFAMSTDDIRIGIGPASAIPKGATVTRVENGGLYLPEAGNDWFFTDRNLVKPSVDAKGSAIELFVFRTRMARVTAPGYQYRPLSALKVVLDERSTSQFVRDGAHLAIFFRGFGDEGLEKLEPTEIIDLLTAVKGNDWSITVLSPPDSPCIYNQTNGAQTPGTTAAPRVEKLLKLVKLAGNKARAISICDGQMRTEMQRALNDAGAGDNYVVTLPEKALWDSIRVETNGNEVVNWAYTPGELKLKLPTYLNNQAKVKIFYEFDDGTKPNVANPDKFKVPVLGEREISPEERTFLADISPILRQACGCHNADRTPIFPNDFLRTRVEKLNIINRIGNNTMPPNQAPATPFSTTPNAKKITDFLNTLK